MRIVKKENCCGCHACFNACPKNAIQMNLDDEGFFYPQINEDKCINCTSCLKVCPVIQKQKFHNRTPILIRGARNKNKDQVLTSSSGGLFEVFATYFFSIKGFICAAVFDSQWNVCHLITNSFDDLDKLKRSKYVQSLIGNSYKTIKELLDMGNNVLFIGTPCQVAGLRSFLKSDYKSLTTIDFACHGVPSLKLWNYFKQSINPMMKFTSINFRDKKKGWRNYCFSYQLLEGTNKIYIKQHKNPFFQAFLQNLSLRPSCYNCQFKHFSSNSDITICDFWGVWKNHKEWDDNRGASVITCNTTNGIQIFDKIKERLDLCSLNFKQAFIDYNGNVLASASMNPKRNHYLSIVNKENYWELTLKLTKQNFITTTKDYIYDILDKTKLLKIIRKFQ